MRGVPRAALGDLLRAAGVEVDLEQAAAAGDDALQRGALVVIEAGVSVKRERSGAVSRPLRVVAPMRVNFGIERRTLRALGPWSIMMSRRKSSIAL
jgi:hypothetical protein